MPDIEESRKTNIDLMCIDELHSHINEGSLSIYQGDSYFYLKTRLLELEVEEADQQRRIDRDQRDEVIRICEDTTLMSRRANHVSSFAIGISVISLMFAIAALFYCTL